MSQCPRFAPRRRLLLWVVLLALLATGCSIGSTANTTVDTQPEDQPETSATTRAPAEGTAGPTEPAPSPTPARRTPTAELATPTRPTTAPETSSRPAQGAEIPAAPVVWETTAREDQGITRLNGAAELTDLEELTDGTLVGVGRSPTGEHAIFVWHPGESEPTMAPVGGIAAGMETLDDEWIALAVIDDFDAGEAHVEIRRLDALDDEPIWNDDGLWSIEGQILDLPGPNFLLAGRRGEPSNQEFTIRSIDDPETFEVLERGYQGNLTLLADGRVTTETGAIFDPNEPERDPLTSDVYGVYTISELADGRIATGWINAWSMYDPVADITTEYPWTGSAYAAPVGLADGRLALNTERGIELFEADDVENPVAILLPPDDAGTTEVLGVNLLYTDTHAISVDDQVGGTWVWDLDQPDVPALRFDGGTPFRVLADGRVVNQTTTGPVVWHPGDLTASSRATPTVQGSLCRAALLDPWLWVGSDSGQIAAWDLDVAGRDPRLFVDTESEIVGLHAGEGEQPVIVTDGGVIVLAGPGSDDEASTILSPIGLVLSSAARENGQIVLGGSNGDVAVVDPAIAGGDPIVLFEGEGSSVTSVAVLADGRVSALLIGDAIMVFDVDGDDQPVRIDLPAVATQHLATRSGMLVAPTAAGFLSFDPDSPNAPPREIPIGTDSYRELVELDDGRLATLDDEGTIWAADPNATQPRFVATARVDAALGCLSPLQDSRLAIADGRKLLVVEVPRS